LLADVSYLFDIGKSALLRLISQWFIISFHGDKYLFT